MQTSLTKKEKMPVALYTFKKIYNKRLFSNLKNSLVITVAIMKLMSVTILYK